jgi:cell division protein FtsL
MFDCALHALHHVGISSYTTLYTLDQDHTELESKVQAEQAQVEVITNLDLNQGKPRCITPNP